MKFKLIVVIIIAFVLQSCTVQKRTHRSGYYIDWHKKSTNVVVEKTAVKIDFVASMDDKIDLPKKEGRNFSSRPIISCGDTLYLLNGLKIICQIIEINETHIKYKQCDNIDGPIYTSTKQSALKIVYINGITEQIRPLSPDNKSGIKAMSQLNPCGDSLIFKDGKILTCKITDEKADYIKYNKCDNSGAEYYVERYKLKEIKKNAGLEKVNPIVEEPKQLEPIKRKINLFSLSAFVLSLLGCFIFLLSFVTSGPLFVISFLFILAAIIFGVVGLVQIKNNKEKYFGSVFSILAFIMPILTLAFVFLIFLLLMGLI